MAFQLTRSTRAAAHHPACVSRLVGYNNNPSPSSYYQSASNGSPFSKQSGWLFPPHRSGFRSRSGVAAASQSRRGFASEATQLVQLLQNELQHESTNYQDNADIKKFLASGEWKLEEKEGDVNMVLTKSAQGGRKVTVEFQLVSPFDSENNGGGGSGGGEANAGEPNDQEMTDFSVTVDSPQGGPGVTFYCTTVQGGEEQSFRYMIGNVRYFESEAEKNNVSAYNGPEFEDLDDSLQQGLDDWLASLGVNETLCDFIDAMSVDKEQREYMRWIGKLSAFLQ